MGTSADIRAENELQHFLNRQEPIFSWTIHNKQDSDQGNLYFLRLISQTWKEIIWTHQLSLFVPKKLHPSDHALLFISGGSNQEGEPKWEHGFSPTLMQIAHKSGCPVATLRQVPNQPLFGDKTEDELLSMTFVQYLESEDPTWPLLFPMVKSAVKAMDAIQEWSETHLEHKIEHFVLAGASKRGWTTWLTGANDPRVTGIGPMVIDILNLNLQMQYQLESWGKYSKQIFEYTEKNLPARINETRGQKLHSLVDPYSYREYLCMPKLIFIGTNDEYWPVDAVKNYFNDLKGKKYIHNVPNAGHDLAGGEQAGCALGAFFAAIAKEREFPNLSWDLIEHEDTVTLRVQADHSLKEANLWFSTSPDRDFRNDKWESQPLPIAPPSQFNQEIPLPKEGFKAFYIECIYPSPLNGTYSLCTQIYVLNKNGVLK